MGVTIVTDSTADLSLEMYEKFGIEMVPLTVYFKDEAYKDWVDIDPVSFYQKLQSSLELPRT